MFGKCFAYGFQLLRRIWRKAQIILLRPAFKRHGRNFVFDPEGQYSFSTIEVGDDVFIGSGAMFSAERGIFIGNKVMFGPNVMIQGGDHNTSVVGQFMYDVKVKHPDDDLPIVIESDVWVGAGVIILKGVTLGRGCIIAAGSVVTKNIPPYAIAAGVPARVRSLRFDIDTIMQHEALLYPDEQRMPLSVLISALDTLRRTDVFDDSASVDSSNTDDLA